MTGIMIAAEDLGTQDSGNHSPSLLNDGVSRLWISAHRLSRGSTELITICPVICNIPVCSWYN